MPVPVVCSCSAKIRVPDHLAGQRVQCPKCRTVLAVPGGAAAPAPAKPKKSRGKSAPGPMPLRDIDEILADSRFSDAESDRLRDALESGERLLWAGKTAPGLHFSSVRPIATAAGGVVMSIVIVTAIMLIGAEDKGIDHIRRMALIPFGLIGVAAVIALIVTPFYFLRKERRSAYAVTDRRVLIWDVDPFLREQFHSLDPVDIAQYSRYAWKDDADSVGSIVFARKRFLSIGPKRYSRPIGFLFIRGFVGVERLLRVHLIDPYTDRLLN
jgi:hypothetical protein